jgi:hypothetical protein
MSLDVTDDEQLTLAALLKRTIKTTATRSRRDFAPSKRYWQNWNPRDLSPSPIPHHRAAHRSVRLTTISTCRPPHLKQTSRSRQSRTGVMGAMPLRELRGAAAKTP